MKKNVAASLIYLGVCLHVLYHGVVVASQQAGPVLAGKERRYFSLGQTDLAKNFLASNPKRLEMRDKNGWTPVAIAAIAGHEDLATHLILQHARVDYTDAHGKSILEHVVANPHSLPVVQLLLLSGAMPSPSQKEKILQVLDERTKNGAHEGYQEIKSFVRHHPCDDEQMER